MNYKVENCEHTNGKSIAATTSVGVVTDPSEEIIGMTFAAETMEEAERLAWLKLCHHIAVCGLKLDNKWFESVAITMSEVEKPDSIFKGTSFESDIKRTATGNRLPDDMYDDACDLMESMQDLPPMHMIAWIMKVGYSEDAAIELFERELGGKVMDTEYSITWLGYKDRSAYTQDDIGIDDHHYFVIPEGEYKWEATFETYGEARAYIDEWCRPKETANKSSIGRWDELHTHSQKLVRELVNHLASVEG